MQGTKNGLVTYTKVGFNEGNAVRGAKGPGCSRLSNRRSFVAQDSTRECCIFCEDLRTSGVSINEVHAHGANCGKEVHRRMGH